MMEVEILSDRPFVMPAPNAYWGRKYGSVTKEGGVFKLKRWGQARGGSDGQPKHYTKILAANAMAKGWLNGERLKSKGTL